MLEALQNNIKHKLKKQNMSIAELERRAGIPHAVINIMHGRSKNPTVRVAQSIAKELNCSIEELFSEGISDFNLCKTELESNTENSDLSIENLKENNTWDPVLLEKSTIAVSNCIKKHNFKDCNIKKVLSCVEDIFTYSISSDSKTIDFRFVDWVVEKAFG